MKAKLHRKFTGKIKTVTLSQVPGGKYYVSVFVEEEHNMLPKIDGKLGIDLGIKDLYITSDGRKYKDIKISKKYCL